MITFSSSSDNIKSDANSKNRKENYLNEEFKIIFSERILNYILVCI